MKKEIVKKILEETKNNYDQIAEHFSATRSISWRSPDYFFSYLKSGDKVLDVGCGNGKLYEAIKDKNIEYLGVDNSKKLIEIARKKFETLNPESETNSKFKVLNSKPRFLVMDALSLEFQNEKFEAVFIKAVLPHIPSQELQIKTIKNVSQILKKNGYLFITCWNLWQPKMLFNNLFNRLKRPKLYCGFGWNDFLVSWTRSDSQKFWRFYHAFTQRELKKLLENNGFKIEQIYYEYRGEKSAWLKGFNIVVIAQKI